MRRSFISGALTILLLMAAFSGSVAQTSKPPAAAAENTLIKVGKPAAVPDPYRSGFAAINNRDARTLLAFLASDGMEGRETGSRGYRLAADYAASLFALWGLEPAGDGVGGAGRGYLQEVVMKEYVGLDGTATWSTGQGNDADGRTFHEGIDLENYYKNRIPEVISAPGRLRRLRAQRRVDRVRRLRRARCEGQDRHAPGRGSRAGESVVTV